MQKITLFEEKFSEKIGGEKSLFSEQRKYKITNVDHYA